jgi:hypothetical protein
MTNPSENRGGHVVWSPQKEKESDRMIFYLFINLDHPCFFLKK